MSYTNLTFVEYRDQYYEKADHTLVDVRSKMEYAQGHVPHAVNIPLNELKVRVNEIDQSKPVVVVCASGNRSMSGSDALVAAGFPQVYNLQGGTMIWMMNSLPLEA
ncbi:MAG: rhodanese-like domain-containing protein [Anaerolineae bacterium]